MKTFEIVAGSYPASVPTAYVVELVRRIHTVSEDFDEGNILNRIWRFRRYELRQLPVRNLRLQWSTSEDEVARFAGMPASASPPIVFDPLDDSIIDGTHRVVAAVRRGDQTVLAYVGTGPDPHWTEEADE